MSNKFNQLFLVVLSMMISTANAAISTQSSKCDDPALPEYKVAQCLYITGLKDNDQQRWIKTSIPGVFEHTFCIGSFEQTHRYTIMEEYYPIKTTQPTMVTDVSICTDQTGTNCQKIMSYKSTCTADGAQGHCDPIDMPVDISSVKDKFPACNPHIQSKIVLQQ